MIDPTIWADDGLGQLGLIERLMFIGLLTLADDEGVAKAEPIYLKANIFPYDTFSVEELETARDRLVDTLNSLQLFTSDDDKEYIQFLKWTTYQKLSKPQPTDNPKPKFKKMAIPQSVRRDIAIRHGLKQQGDKQEVLCHWCKTNKGEICWITPSWVHFKNLEMDHVIPESQGGTNISKNIVLSCRSCNRIRSNQVRVKSESSNPPNRIEENRKEKKGIEENGFVVSYIEKFNELFHTKYTVTDGRTQKLKARLEKYPIEKVLEALSNLSKSDFHRGKNDRGWAADPDFLIRNDESVDKWLNHPVKDQPKIIRSKIIDQL